MGLLLVLNCIRFINRLVFHQFVSFAELLLCGGSCWLHHLHLRGSQVLSTALRRRGDRFHVAIFYNDAQDVATSQGFLH